MKDQINYEEVSLSIADEIAKRERDIKILNGLVEKTIIFQNSPAILEKFASSQRKWEEEIRVLKMNLELCDEEHTLDLNSNVGVDCDLLKHSLERDPLPKVYGSEQKTQECQNEGGAWVDGTWYDSKSYYKLNTVQKTQEWQEGSPFDYGYKVKLSKK